MRAPGICLRRLPSALGALALCAATAASAQEAVVVCDLPKSELGTEIDQRPESGRAVWTLYDTAPDSTGPRAFHVTGFKDGCARRLTGALAMFGSVELYELVRFGGLAPADDAPTDRAYAALRAPLCGAEPLPCTGNGLRRLARATAFVNVFPVKGDPAHLELLLSDGDLAATARK